MNSWLWPDKVIGKRESRLLRNEHNEAVNLNAELVEALECYAAHAEWTAEVFLQGENADGSEWEFTHDLDSEKVWNRAEHGWLLAQTTLAKARGDAQGNGG